MNNITNRTLLTAMIIIGAIIAIMIVPLYPNKVGVFNTRNLGATAYIDNNNYAYTGGAYLNTNYPVTAFRTSATDTVTTTQVVPQTTSYTTYTYSYPETTTQNYPYGNDGISVYDSYGCKAGANYSVTTGQPCYGYNNNNNYNPYNYNYNNNNGGYYSNGVYVDYRGCGTGIIYSVTTGQRC